MLIKPCWQTADGLFIEEQYKMKIIKYKKMIKVPRKWT